MSDPIHSDPGLRAAQTALDGLARRQETIGDNLANVDTPGYRARAVNFESALRQARQGLRTVGLELTRAGHLAGRSESTPVRVATRTGGSTRADGNNVDVDLELTQMAETGIRYQAFSQLVSKKLLLLKSIATGR